MPSAKPIRIPFDSLTLSAVVWELEAFVGGKVQGIHQPDPYSVGIGLYAGRIGAGMLLISCHPEFARAHLTTRRVANQGQPPAFCATLRSRLEGGFVTGIKQIDFDRVLQLEIEHPGGRYRVIAELMGKHSNVMLVDEEKKLLSAMKWVGRSKSSRPIQPGSKYHPPPFVVKPPFYESVPGDDAKEFNGASPFLLKLMEADPTAFDRMRACASQGVVAPVLSPGHGAYPISVAALGLKEFERASISVALEQHYDVAIPAREAEALRASLLHQIERVLLAREVAISDLGQAEETARRAGELQLFGELLLAHGRSLPAGSSMLESLDYEGNEVRVPLDPTLTFMENSNAFFEKAKHAKARVGLVKDQIERLSRERIELRSLAEEVRASTRLQDLQALQEEARKRRWLHSQPPPSLTKEERPFEGHRVRELIGPGGWTILFGENAEANDYLILRVAKPNDWWLHVRGNVSSHVVIVTKNQPEKVGREVLEFAARIAAQHSGLKHSGYVPVDYTLKKYVRKPRGAAKGSAFYTHEKTIHVN